MSVDANMVRHVAKLARLALEDHEVEALRRDLEEIVAYVRQLDEVDTTGVEPMTRVATGSAPMRPDVVSAGLDHAQALAEAPRVLGDGFAVPGFVDDP